jgi:hypothetical protein
MAEVNLLAPLPRPRRNVQARGTAKTPEVVSWALTARFHDYPQGWLRLFAEASYTGDYYWTIIE